MFTYCNTIVHCYHGNTPASSLCIFEVHVILQALLWKQQCVHFSIVDKFYVTVNNIHILTPSLIMPEICCLF